MVGLYGPSYGMSTTMMLDKGEVIIFSQVVKSIEGTFAPIIWSYV